MRERERGAARQASELDVFVSLVWVGNGAASILVKLTGELGAGLFARTALGRPASFFARCCWLLVAGGWWHHWWSLVIHIERTSHLSLSLSLSLPLLFSLLFFFCSLSSPHYARSMRGGVRLPSSIRVPSIDASAADAAPLLRRCWEWLWRASHASR